MTEELVFTVERTLLFPADTPQGLSFDVEPLLQRCAQHGRFSPRSRVETDPSIKQLIPYIVLYHDDSLFCVRRLKTQSEERLHNLMSVGIGGHMNPIEANEQFDVILAKNAHRELHEELVLKDEGNIHWAAIVNDDSNPVGQVHTGLIGLVSTHPLGIRVRERDKMSGGFQPYEKLMDSIDGFETWSQLVLSHWCKLRSQVKG